MKTEVFVRPPFTSMEEVAEEVALWDATTASWVAQCPRLAECRILYALRSQEEAYAATAGKAIHAGLALFYTGSSLEECLAEIARVWGHDADWRLPPNHRWVHLHLGHLEVVFRNYVDYAKKHDTFKPLPVRREDLKLDDVIAGTWQVTDDGLVVLGESKFVMEFELELPDGSTEVLVHSGKPDLPIEMGGGIFILDHKAQPLSAKILTPSGWTTMGALKVGDLIIGSDGYATRVVGIFPQGVQPVFDITLSDRTVVRSTDDHFWRVNEAQGNKWQTLTLAALRAKPRLRSWRLPALAPVQYAPRAPAVLHPYVLGVLLGDGCLCQKNGTITLSSADDELIETVRSLLPLDCNDIGKYTGNNYSWIIRSRAGKTHHIVRDELRRLGLMGTRSRTKFIPEEYLHASIENRLALLQGLMDTDGTASGGYAKYTTISPQLRDGLVELVQSLGGQARWHEPASQRGRYTVAVALPVNPFRLRRKAEAVKPRSRSLARHIVSVEPSGEEVVQCIQVAARDHLYVTDGFTLTVNTTSSYLSDWYFAKYKFSNQLRGYCAMLKSLTGLQVGGALINGVYVGAKASDSKFTGGKVARYGPMNYQPAHLTEALLNQHYWKQALYTFHAQGYFPQNAGQSCTSCDYAPLCATSPAMRESAMKTDYKVSEKNVAETFLSL